MTSRPPFATLADIQTRHPGELAVLAMDEATRQVDAARVVAACEDASDEIRAFLASKYTADELDRVDEASARVLRLFAIDIAMYRMALPPRQTDAIRDRYSAATGRLRDFARGVGALTIVPAGGPGASLPADVVTTGSPHEALIDVPERLFTRRRFGGAG